MTSVLRAFAVLLLFAALAVAHTWPLAERPASRVPGDADVMTGMWSLTDMARQIAADPAHLLEGRIFYPFQTTLAVLDHQISSAALAAPLVAAGADSVLVYNAIVLLTFVLSGLAMYALVGRLTGSTAAGLVAGTAFAFSGFRAVHFIQAHLLATIWLPVALLALHAYLERPSGWRWVGFAVSAGLVALSSWHIAVIGGLTIGLVALWTMAADRQPLGHRLLGLVAAGALSAALLAPLALAYSRMSAQWPPRTSGGRETLVTLAGLSANVTGLVAPAGASRAPYASLLATFESSQPGIFPGLMVVLLAAPAVLGLARVRGSATTVGLTFLRWWFRVGLALVAVVVLAAAVGEAGEPVVRWVRPLAPVVILGLALGAGGLVAARRAALVDSTLRLTVTYTTLAVAGALLALGPRVFVGPVDIGSGLWRFDLLPVRLIIRAPERLSLLVAVGASVLAGIGTVRLLGRVPARARGLTVVAILALLNLDLAFRTPALVAAPGMTDADRWLAEAEERGAVVEYPLSYPNHWAAYRSQRYGRRIVNGTGYLFPEEFIQLEDAPDLGSRQIELLWEHFHPRFAVVRFGLYEPDERAALTAAIDARPEALRLRARFEDEAVYEVVDRGRGPELFRRWSRAALAGARGLVLQASVTAGRPGTVSELVVALNGRTLAEVRGAGVERPSAHVVPFAASDLAPIMNTFELWADYRFEESAPRHPIGRTGVALPADVEVRAARERATVRVNGRLLRPDRGYLLAVLDPDTGEIVDLGRFDTSWYAAEAARLAAFVEALPDGTPVVVATEFDASRALTPAAVAAFRTLGLEVDLQGQFQVMHAAVGVKGAPPGSALEASGPLQAAVDLGRPDIREVELRSLLLR